MRLYGACIIAVCMVCGATSLVAQERPYDVAVFGTFTTSSKLFHHPNDPDQQLRDQFLPLDNIFSIGIDLRREVELLRIQIGLSIEDLSKTSTMNLPSPVTTLANVEATDGYTAFPIELTGYFGIPVGTDRLHLYMGGGGGVYLGRRPYTYAGAQSQTTSTNPGFGIHILSGIEYMLNDRVSIRSELKFRDVQFETTNKFTNATVVYHETVVPLDTQPFTSRIHADGMTMTLGLALHF